MHMAEVLMSFDDPVSHQGHTYHARVVGRQADDGMWEGWLEFEPLQGEGDPVIGRVESRQPERTHLAYWATGLTPVFLQGALQRALSPLTVVVRLPEVPLSDEPAPRMRAAAGAPTVGPEAVLDPFAIGRRSLDVLRSELSALNRPRLLNIIAAHGLNPAGEDIAWMSDLQLGTFIVTAVDAQMRQAR